MLLVITLQTKFL